MSAIFGLILKKIGSIPKGGRSVRHYTSGTTAAVEYKDRTSISSSLPEIIIHQNQNRTVDRGQKSRLCGVFLQNTQPSTSSNLKSRLYSEAEVGTSLNIVYHRSFLKPVNNYDGAVDIPFKMLPRDVVPIGDSYSDRNITEKIDPLIGIFEMVDPCVNSVCGNSIEKVDPLHRPIRIEAPSASPIVEYRASSGPYSAERMRRRRYKMKRHKRRKWQKRSYYKYQAYHLGKKTKAEKRFRTRMNELIVELRNFDAEKYVRETIKRAKKAGDMQRELVAPTGERRRQNGLHWSSLMSLEELYAIPKDDYIDKTAGYPDEEDLEEIKRLRAEYYEKFAVEKK